MNKAKILDYLFSALMVFLLTMIYSLISIYILPEGINQVFVESLWKRLLLPVPPIVAALGAFVYFFQNKRFHYTKAFEPIEKQDWLFVLIPLLPIVKYIIANQEMLSFLNSILVVLPFALLSIGVCVLLPVFLSFLAKKYFLIAGSTAFLFSLLNMAALSSAYNWTETGSLGTQLAVFAAALLIISLSKLLPRKLVSNIIVLVFAVNVGMSGFSGGSLENRESSGKPADMLEAKDFPLFSQLEERRMVNKTDIYLIVYEGYAPLETLEHYGFDNSNQVEYLRRNGFHYYRGVYSLAAPTTASMTYVFNLDPLKEAGKEAVSGTNVVKQNLNVHNYSTHYVSLNDYMFRGLSFDHVDWDHPFPPISRKKQFSSEVSLIWKAILKGEFSDGVSLEGVGKEEFLERKHQIISGKYASPLFMYSHSKDPGHGPSGMGVEPSESQKYIDRYIEGIEKANEEMRRDVELVIEHNPEAIVILAGDHGPFLTKDGYGLNRRDNFEAADVDRYDIQDRFGTFLAIRWPEPEYAQHHDIRILQDIFPAVFSYLYDDETLFEKTRMEPTLISTDRILGVSVRDGIVVGGKNSGEPLFLGEKEEKDENRE